MLWRRAGYLRPQLSPWSAISCLVPLLCSHLMIPHIWLKQQQQRPLDPSQARSVFLLSAMRVTHTLISLIRAEMTKSVLRVCRIVGSIAPVLMTPQRFGDGPGLAAETSVTATCAAIGLLLVARLWLWFQRELVYYCGHRGRESERRVAKQGGKQN